MKKPRIIKWTRFFPDVVVWISVAKLDASWKKDGIYYVGVGACGPGNAKPTKCKAFGEWLKQGDPVWMPHIGISDGHVSFSDGRHRFAWLRDHGVRTLPVTVSPDIAAEIRRCFGTKSRTSRLRMKNDANAS